MFTGSNAASPETWLAARGCLELLWSTWTDCPVTAEGRATLDRIADRMPAIPRIGLELRLGRDSLGRDNGVTPDLHQLFLSAPGERALLLEYLDRTSSTADEDSTPAFHLFLRRWVTDDAFAAAFPQLYLEYDVPAEDVGEQIHLVPSAFLDVHRRTGSAADRLKREAMALEAISQMVASDQTALDSLRSAFAAVAERGSIGHLGLMFARGNTALRLNVRDMQRGALLPFLRAIDWPGDMVSADATFERLIDETDRVTVALDLAGAWLPRIGFEAFIEHPPRYDPRHQRLFDWLCAEGLCAPDLASAVMTYPGISMPGLTGQHWPAPWVVATLLAPGDRLPLLRRELSHVKVTIEADGQRHAKAYLGAVHDWRTAAGTKEPPATHPARTIGEAIAAAEAFLISRTKQGGYWRDFHLDIGFSDEWVTAFVGVNLMRAGGHEGRKAAMRGLAWLARRQRSNGGWGYNATSPGDADSTAWGLRLAIALGVEDAMTAAARVFLQAHLLGGGGVATYARTTPIRFRGALLDAAGAAGWRCAHDCVAANAAPLLGAQAMKHLRRAQGMDGAWRSHWWTRDLFATALGAEALVTAPEAGDDARIDRAILWAKDETSIESAFDLACFLSLGHRRLTSDDLAAWTSPLIALQREDGGWPGSAGMLFPLPWQSERSEDMMVHSDLDGYFTTAIALAALAGVASQQRTAR